MTEKRRHLFSIWIPGQICGGKNRTKIQFQERADGSWATRRIPMRRRSKRTGRKEPTPFERYAPAAIRFLYYQRPPRPWPGPVRLEIDYWWKDRTVRDEDGRSGVIGNILENARWVESDGDLRSHWWYRGHDKVRAGVRVRGYTEIEANRVPPDGNGYGPWGTTNYAVWIPKPRKGSP